MPRTLASTSEWCLLCWARSLVTSIGNESLMRLPLSASLLLVASTGSIPNCVLGCGNCLTPPPSSSLAAGLSAPAL
jgi:hypothetical protein